MKMPSESGIKVVKSPVTRTEEGDFLEYAYQDTVIYYVRLSNGTVATKPEDFPSDEQENEGLSTSEIEKQD
jgi:hypothetical protein